MPVSVAGQILAAVGPSCRDGSRREILGDKNGIDFVEFEEVEGRLVLHVHFLLDLPASGPALDAYRGNLRMHGGIRITDIAAVHADRNEGQANVLDVEVDRQGDFSPYLLALDWKRDVDGAWRFGPSVVDRLFSVAAVNFRPGCRVDFDCLQASSCPPEALAEPALDYLAKDYASFRQMLLDLAAQRNPSWTERNPADLGMALLELLAYTGDQLSYFQDAVANEAFLDTARQRVSARRHARLVDYQMHDGRNAWAPVHLQVATAGTVPVGTQLLTRIGAPLRFDRKPGVTPPLQPATAPGTLLSPILDGDFRTDPALAPVRVFETATTVVVDPRNNELRIHAWGAKECCLPRGATTAHLYAVDPVAQRAIRPPLERGDRLLLEEIRGAATGAAADADPAHRCVVLIDAVAEVEDPLFTAVLDPNTREPAPVDPAQQPVPALPLLEVTWGRHDALPFPLQLTIVLDRTQVQGLSVARGNIALADHGRTVLGEAHRGVTGVRLAQGPLTMQCEPEGLDVPTGFPPLQERADLGCEVRAAKPAIALQTRRAGNVTGTWTPVRDLLSSTELQRHFVAEVAEEGRAAIRFGDGVYGERPAGVDDIEVWYRVGNGRAGNIGADALAHVVEPDSRPTAWPSIAAVRNPLPARDAVDPETIEQVRERAPAEFRSVQLRAVTEGDYREAALTVDGVAGAVASFRWTGSWYTVLVGIDPAEEADVTRDSRGVTRLGTELSGRVLDALTRYRLAGYDLEIGAARYVPLDVEIALCARRGYFAADVAHAVALALGPEGLFDPRRLTFGHPVFLSRIYAAAESVEGVESAAVTVLKRHDRPASGELERGQVEIGPWEIARLDNDPSNMENGTLTITAGDVS